MMKTTQYIITTTIAVLVSMTAFAAPPGSGWSKVWYDEFNDWSTPSSKWYKHDTKAGTYGWYYPNLANENGSVLIIDNKSLSGTGSHGEKIQGARIDSKTSWNRGYFEARCRLDWANNHCWPTFWIWKWQPGTEATEFDIMEYTHWHSTPTQSHHYQGKTGTSTRTSGTSVSSYHTWGLLWTASEVSFYIDDNWKFSSSNPSDPGSQTLPIILSSSPNNQNLPAPGENLPRFFVDWVRVWQGGTPPPPTGQRPYGGVNRTFPGRVEGEHYDLGGENVAYHDTTSGNSGGQLRSDRVDIGTGDGGQVIGWTASGEWLEYTINVTGGQYTLKARVASPYSGKRIVVKVDNSVLRTLTVPNTGSWHSYQDVNISGVWIGSKNDRVLRLEFPDGGLNFNWIQLQ